MNPVQPVDQTTLNAVMADEFRHPEGKLAIDFLPGLMQNLGSPDSGLRENSLDVMWNWLENGQFDEPTIIHIADQMSKNLKNGLGEIDTDSVFLRAFSALILGVTISLDRQQREKGVRALFDDSQVHGWLEDSLTLLQDENDLRGYTQDKGWAHCMAHTGDLLNELALHPSLKVNDLEKILNSLHARFTKPVEQTFVHHEDERLAAVVIHILQRDLVPMEFYEQWLERFVNVPGGISWKDAYTHPTANNARVNTKSFLRGIYFLLVFGYQNDPLFKTTLTGESLKPVLINSLRQIYPNFRYGES